MKDLRRAFGGGFLAAQLLRKLNQRFLVVVGKRSRRQAQDKDAREFQSLGSVHGHQLHSIFEDWAAEFGRRQRRHWIVLPAILGKASTRLAQQLDVLQEFAQSSLPH